MTSPANCAIPENSTRKEGRIMRTTVRPANREITTLNKVSRDVKIAQRELTLTRPGIQNDTTN
jgi:hypothetical protein